MLSHCRYATRSDADKRANEFGFTFTKVWVPSSKVRDVALKLHATKSRRVEGGGRTGKATVRS